MAEQLLGAYRCRVESTADPEKLLRVSVRILGLWDSLPNNVLPWAEYRLPLGARAGEGDFTPCEVGDLVWVEFEQGDSRWPIITGSVFYAPNGVPTMAAEAFAGEGMHQHKRAAGEPTPPATAYHADKVFKNGDILTQYTKNGGWRATHLRSGSTIELSENGEIVLHSEHFSYRSSTGDTIEKIGGDYQLSVTGDVSITCQNVQVTSRGDTMIKGERVEIKAASEVYLKAPLSTVEAPSIKLVGNVSIE